MSMAEHYAHKDAERADGSVDFDKVPMRYGGYLDTGHSEDEKWWSGNGPRPDGVQ